MKNLKSVDDRQPRQKKYKFWMMYVSKGSTMLQKSIPVGNVVLCLQKKDNGKRKNTRTNDYCEKCKKYICRSCFKHSNSNSKL